MIEIAITDFIFKRVYYYFYTVNHFLTSVLYFLIRSGTTPINTKPLTKTTDPKNAVLTIDVRLTRFG